MEELRTITLERTGKRPLRFTGVAIWEWRSSPDRASVHYSGSPGRWRRITVYRTRDGRAVVHDQHRTNWQGEQDQADAAVFASLEAVLDYLEAACPAAAPAFAREFDLVEELGDAGT